MPKILGDNWPEEAAVEAAWNRALASGLNAWVTEEGMRAALIAARDTAPEATSITNDVISLLREIVAIDPKSGGGRSMYFVTGEFIARARQLLDECNAIKRAAEG